jgi:hypothetical protein
MLILTKSKFNMTTVKFMNGDVSYYDESDIERLRDIISSDMKLDRRMVGLIENEEKNEDKVDFFVLVDKVLDMYILNMTEKNFLVYQKNSPIDKGYMNVLKSLMKKDSFGYSHWSRDDKIIFVPYHLQDYVTKEYGRIFI